METPDLKGKKIAILTESGFEESELISPKKALEDCGAQVDIVSMQDKVKGWNKDHWSVELKVDVNLEGAVAADYDALLIPGGVINPDKMRKQPIYIEFATSFFSAGKPVAAICHGPQLLIETGMLSGKDVTSFSSIKTDLINAGANWYDQEVVVDNGLITSRSPEDLEAFNQKIIEEFAKGPHSPLTALPYETV